MVKTTFKKFENKTDQDIVERPYQKVQFSLLTFLVNLQIRR